MPPQKSVTRGRWRSVALSLLLHGAIVAAAVYGWFTWKHKPPEPETIAIEGSVVDERALKGISPPPEPAPTPAPQAEPVPEPEPPPPEEQGPPKPDPEEVKRKEEERLAQEKAEQEKQEQLQREKEAQELKLKEEAEQQKIEEQKQAAARAAAEKRAAEKKRAEEARKAAEEKARQAQEEELRRSLEAEERGNAARNSAEAERWKAAIAARIERAWIRPTQAEGVTCIVLVSQVPGGEVTSVRVDSCDPDNAALRDSVEAAVIRASPLPPPPAGVPFERNLRLRFAPQ